MSRLNHVESIGSANVSASPYIENYIVNATSTITITLPAITADGMHFVFSRMDNTNNTVNIVIQPLTSDNISVGVGLLQTSITLSGYQALEFHSHTGVWYGIYKSVTVPGSSGLFSSSVISNSSNPLINFNIIYFPYAGTSSSTIIDRFIIVFNTNTPGVTFTFGYTNGTTQTVITNFSFPLNPLTQYQPSVYVLTNANKALLPVSETILYVSATGFPEYSNFLVY